MTNLVRSIFTKAIIFVRLLAWWNTCLLVIFDWIFINRLKPWKLKLYFTAKRGAICCGCLSKTRGYLLWVSQQNEGLSVVGVSAKRGAICCGCLSKTRGYLLWVSQQNEGLSVVGVSAKREAICCGCLSKTRGYLLWCLNCIF